MIKAQNEMNGSVSLHAEQAEEEEDKKDKDDKFDKSHAMMGILKSNIIHHNFFFTVLETV
jgi:hypothetical protein